MRMPGNAVPTAGREEDQGEVPEGGVAGRGEGARPLPEAGRQAGAHQDHRGLQAPRQEGNFWRREYRCSIVGRKAEDALFLTATFLSQNWLLPHVSHLNNPNVHTCYL